MEGDPGRVGFEKFCRNGDLNPFSHFLDAQRIGVGVSEKSGDLIGSVVNAEAFQITQVELKGDVLWPRIRLPRDTAGSNPAGAFDESDEGIILLPEFDGVFGVLDIQLEPGRLIRKLAPREQKGYAKKGSFSWGICLFVAEV